MPLVNIDEYNAKTEREQAVYELRHGASYYPTREEEQRMEQHNQQFQMVRKADLVSLHLSCRATSDMPLPLSNTSAEVSTCRSPLATITKSTTS